MTRQWNMVEKGKNVPRRCISGRFPRRIPRSGCRLLLAGSLVRPARRRFLKGKAAWLLVFHPRVRLLVGDLADGSSLLLPPPCVGRHVVLHTSGENVAR